jgi:hypothetical protein
MVSEHAGFQAGQEVADTDSRLFELQQTADTPHALLRLVRVVFSKRANTYLPHVISAKTSPYTINRLQQQTTLSLEPQNLLESGATSSLSASSTVKEEASEIAFQSKLLL